MNDVLVQLNPAAIKRQTQPDQRTVILTTSRPLRLAIRQPMPAVRTRVRS